MSNKITEEALSLIREERLRVIHSEHFTHETDKQYKNNELVNAAACYITGKHNKALNISFRGKVLPHIWPWDPAWYKPTNDRKRELVKGIALAVAELEQLLISEQEIQQIIKPE